MSSRINRLDNGNIEITLTIPWPNIQKASEAQIEEAIKNAEIKGFRKGQAPRSLVEPQLKADQLYSHALQHLLPEAYAQAVKDHSLKPLLHPHITVKSGQHSQDWIFTATTCEAPPVTLPPKLTSDLNELRKLSSVKVPDLLVEEEINHRLSALAENLTSLGLTTQKYLETKKLTPETLKANLATQARADLEMEFILAEIQKTKQLKDRKSTLDYLKTLV